jgi:radical SAM protein with 4Fe4S-binding SPASM domain
MSFEELRFVADKLIQALSKWNKKGKIAITGGEPFVKSELFPLLQYLNESPQIANIYILSNGTLIDEKICKEIGNIKKVSRVQISLDGASARTHNAIRGEGTFEKAIEAIKLLNNHADYGVKVNLMFTLQKCNKEDIPALFDLAIENKINSLLVERFVPCGSGKEIESEMLSSHELQEVFQYISDRADLEYDKGNRLMVVKQRPLWINIDLEKANVNAKIPLHKQVGGICSIGFDNLTILHDGTILPCRRLNIPLGNLKHDTLFEIWYDSEVLWDIRNKRNLKGKCNSCELIPLCSGCRAMAYACTGEYLGEDTQCWK